MQVLQVGDFAALGVVCCFLSLLLSEVKRTDMFREFAPLHLVVRDTILAREASSYHIRAQFLSHSLDGVPALRQQSLVQALLRLLVGCLTEKYTDVYNECCAVKKSNHL